MGERGYCLVKQELEDLISKGRIRGDGIIGGAEGQARMSSFEPRIEDEVFVLTEEAMQMFRPSSSEQVYPHLLRIPKKHRPRFDMGEGFTISRGNSYLFHLNERIISEPDMRILSSPRSSFGRKFLNTRLYADHNVCFNEIDPNYSPDTELDLWLLVQPLWHDLIIAPGLRINQLRFFKGLGARLSDPEILEEHQKNPLLYDVRDGELFPIERPVISNGLQLHASIKGENSSGIFAFRARENTVPIDCRQKGLARVEDYFDPMIAGKDDPIFKPDTPYLIASKEYNKVPAHLSAELLASHHAGMRGPMHFAGFLDPAFKGLLVCEVVPKEETNMRIIEDFPLSRLEWFRTRIDPDTLYGEGGSSYSGQMGPKPSSYFKGFDWEELAGTFESQSEMVMVEDRKKLEGLRGVLHGYVPLTKTQRNILSVIEKQAFFHRRYDCEEDELLRQFIPYVIVFGPDETVHQYRRKAIPKKDKEHRLYNRLSIGHGGHVLQSDGPDYIANAALRSLKEELSFEGDPEISILGTLCCSDEYVDSVHFGVVHAMYLDSLPKLNKPHHDSGRFVSIDDLLEEADNPDWESWSRYLLPHLRGIYNTFRST